MSKSLFVAICFLFVFFGMYFFIKKSENSDPTGRPERAFLKNEIQPFAKAMGGESFQYFDRNVILGLQSSEMKIGSGNLPKLLDQVATGAGWSFHSVKTSPYSHIYHYCKGRLSLSAEVVNDSNNYWQYGVYWESDKAGSSYCNETK